MGFLPGLSDQKQPQNRKKGTFFGILPLAQDDLNDSPQYGQRTGFCCLG
jgi:hypothetical protein